MWQHQRFAVSFSFGFPSYVAAGGQVGGQWSLSWYGAGRAGALTDQCTAR